MLAELLTPGGPTVLHSLRLPMAGIEADIDHLDVLGKHVGILDAKVWRQAFCWTLGSNTRRGWRRDAFADKHTSDMAETVQQDLFVKRCILAVVLRPYIVVWPSSPTKAINLAFYGPQARAIRREVRDTKHSKLAAGGPADPAIMAAPCPVLSTARLAATQDEQPPRSAL